MIAAYALDRLMAGQRAAAGTIAISLLMTIGTVFAPPVWASGDSEINAEADDEMFFGNIPSVFSASKHEQEVTQAPASVSVITAEEIERYGYRTLAEILASFPGVYQTDDRNYGYVGVRGFSRPGDYNSRILILVNGRRVDDAIYQSSSVQKGFPIDIDLIDRVEMIRGPGSALYGSAAMIGLVNVITKRGRDYDGFEASAELHSYETYKLRGTYGVRLPSGFELLLSASVYESEGDNHLYYPEFDDPLTNNGVYEFNDEDKSRKFMAELGYGDFSFSVAGSRREKEVPTASYDTIFNDDEAQTVDEYLIAGLSYISRWKDKYDVNMAFGFVDFQEKGDYPYDWPPVVVNYDRLKAKSYDVNLQVGFDFNEQNRLLLGTEIRYSSKMDMKNFDEEVYLDVKNDAYNWGIFLQDEIMLAQNLNAVIGLRYDHYETFGSSVSPRVAFIYNSSDKNTWKFLYGDAFRAPNEYEFSYNDGGETWKSPAFLDPETMRNFEVSWEHRYNENIRVVSSVYKYKMDDVITLVTDPVDDLLVFQNQSKVKARGLEVEIEGNWLSGIDGSLSYSYVDGHNEDPSSDLINAPEHMAKLSFGYPILSDKLTAAVDLQYQSRRMLLNGGYSRSAFIANLGLLSRKLSDSWRLSATLYNLFDVDLEYPAGEEHVQRVIPQNGRSFRIKLTGTF
jgi:outer membrane receptor for ferrienterochelin and colicins